MPTPIIDVPSQLPESITAALALKAPLLNPAITGGTIADLTAQSWQLDKVVAVPASGTTWDSFQVKASTITLAPGGAAPTALCPVTFAAPTITAPAPGYVIPSAATVTIAGPPVAAGSTTITNPLALHVAAGNAYFAGNLSIGAVPTASCLLVSMPNDYAKAPFITNPTSGSSSWLYLGQQLATGRSVGIGFTDNADATNGYGWFSIYGDSAGGGINVFKGGGVGIGSVTRLASTALQVLASKSVVSAAGAVWDGVKFAASTLTLTGATTPVTALSFTTIEAPTITSASAITVATAATVTIQGPPVAAGSTTITAPLALRVVTGPSSFGGAVGVRGDCNAVGIGPIVAVADGSTGIGTALSLNATSLGGKVWSFISQASGGFAFYDGAAYAMYLDVNRNLFVGSTPPAGINSQGAIILSNAAVAPTTSGDICHLYSADNGAGHATLAIYCEEVVAAVGIKVTTEVLPVFINGTLKYIALAA
jgi:hypothetical protein